MSYLREDDGPWQGGDEHGHVAELDGDLHVVVDEVHLHVEGFTKELLLGLQDIHSTSRQ